MKHTFGPKTFKTKKEIKDYFRDYLKAGSVGDELAKEHLNVMKDLIKCHPEYDEIWGDRFKIGIGKCNTKNYHVYDGETWWTFSYLKCIKAGNKNKNHTFNIARAARECIRDQISEYLVKMEFNEKYLCEIDKKHYHRCDVHVDHDFDKKTFAQLLKEFIGDRANEDIKLVYNDGHHLFNEIDSEAWYAFHLENATLRIIHKRHNLSKKQTV